MLDRRIGSALIVGLLLTACSGGDPLSSITDLQPDPVPAPDQGPPPPKPRDLLATTPPRGMTGRIVYQGEVNNGFFSVHLFMTLPDGSNPVGLFPNDDPIWYTGPSWGPSGNKLAVASNSQGQAEWDIYTVNTDGSGLTHVVAGPSSGDFAPAWSPDGSKIVFQSTANDTTGFDIFSFDVESGAMTNLTNSVGDDELPAWSPDGAKVLYQTTVNAGTNLWLMNPDGSGKVSLTEGAGQQNSAGVFSPDGSLIAFESTLHQPVTGQLQLGDFEIYVMNSDGSDPRRLTVGVGAEDVARFPTWSPDGKHIAFEFHDFTISQLFSVTDIAVMNADGSNVFLLENQPVEARFPRWGP